MIFLNIFVKVICKLTRKSAIKNIRHLWDILYTYKEIFSHILMLFKIRKNNFKILIIISLKKILNFNISRFKKKKKHVIVMSK